MLMGLPRNCSGSEMFDEDRVNCFYTEIGDGAHPWYGS